VALLSPPYIVGVPVLVVVALRAVEIFELCFNKCGGCCHSLSTRCCTYAPLNHEMQSNLRSSNGKYCVYPQSRILGTPTPAGHFKTVDRIGGCSCQWASVRQLELTALDDSSSEQLAKTRPVTTQF